MVGLAIRERPRNRLSLRVEQLEDRVNPSSFTFFDTSAPPDASTAHFDTSPVELGVQFQVQASGTVNAIQFYRDVPIDSGYVAHLWNEDGDLLASGVIIEGQGPTPGWQTVQFAAVWLNPGETYTASYYASAGGYSYSYDFFAGEVSNGPLVAPAEAGVYVYGNGGGFPTQSYLASNYWVTPVFTPFPAPTITGISPASGPAEGGNLVRIYGSNFDVPDFRRIYFGSQESPAHNFISPNELLVQVPPGVVGTVDVRIEALGGVSENTSADDYTYLGEPGPFTLFNTEVPPIAATADFDTSPVELGVQFQVQQSGTIDAIQFYRGVAIDSGYTVHLWDGDGDLLASGVVIEGQGPTPGWQAVEFGPVRVDPGQTYTASYYASAGGYSFSYDYFTDEVQVGPLLVPVQGGVYLYGTGGGFPTQSYRDSNYSVTPVFTPYPAPTITAILPASGPEAGGNLVRILGANFEVPDFRRIYFGGQLSPAHNFISPNELLVQVPPGSGTVDVSIEALGGVSENTPADDYTYLSDPGFWGPF